jgi:membrane fusion protein, macrolide-specific efflux system
MRPNKVKLIFLALVLLAGVVFLVLRAKRPAQEEAVLKEIVPAMGRIQNIISTTGTVLPKNRLEVKPPVNGRVEQILVKEGQRVKAGEILAWMSSTERAAMLDVARGHGEEALKYWQDVYKPIPLVSPIDAEVIVATLQPGTTVTTGDAVVVLSDALIIRAQVDETDIGKIKVGQDALIALDAYPETKIKAQVEHVYYESQTVNNVTIYQVDLGPGEVPLFFRSGMNATVDFVEQSKDNALIIPQEAVLKEREGDFVYVKNGSQPSKVKVTLGLFDDKNVEVLSGISEKDKIIVKGKKYSLPKSSTGTNPFMPARRNR